MNEKNYGLLGKKVLLTTIRARAVGTNMAAGSVATPFTLHYCKYSTGTKCCGSETFHYGSGSDFSTSSGSGSNIQKSPDPSFFLKKYDFEGPKMALQNIILKEYLNLVY
jgi:hypothetical protein